MRHAESGLVDPPRPRTRAGRDRPRRGPQRSLAHPPERALDLEQQVEQGSGWLRRSGPRRRRSGTAADRRRQPGPSGVARRRRLPRRRPPLSSSSTARASVVSLCPRFAPSPTYASVTRACARRPPPRSRPVGRGRRPACGRGRARLSTAVKALDDPVRPRRLPAPRAGTAPGPRTRPARARRDADSRRCRRCGRSSAASPCTSTQRSTRNRRPSLALLLEVAVVAEDHQAPQFDRHAVILPRSTAAATASASTVSRTSCARIIDAPRSNAATAAASEPRHRPCGRPSLAQDLPERALPRDPDRAPAYPARPNSSSRRTSSRFWSAVLPKPIPGSTQIRSSPIPLFDGERKALLEEGQHIGDDVVVMRSDLHRPRRALHVHETDERVSVSDDRGHVRVVAQGGDVVDEDGPQLESAAAIAAGSCRSKRKPAEPLEHRHHARDLLRCGDRRSPRTGRFAANVDDVRSAAICPRPGPPPPPVR